MDGGEAIKRQHLYLSSDGDDDASSLEGVAELRSGREHGAVAGCEGDDKRNIEEDGHVSTPAGPHNQVGNLYQRRANASPEKFDKGCFEPPPLSLTPETASELTASPAKKAKTSNRLEILYDPSGRPRLVSMGAIQGAGRTATNGSSDQQPCSST